MNPLKCEMCMSTDMVKQDGMFVCQSCGTKYSVEEAKKMMVEGTVDVTGTVKVDNSSFVEKYLANARRAKQKEDWEKTEKYYNLVEQNDPTNIEAIFYSAYGKAKVSLTDSDIYKRQAAFKVLQNCVSIIDDNFDVRNEEENRKIVEQISNDILGMANSSYVYKYTKNGYGNVVSSEENQTRTLFNQLGLEFITTLENIATKIPDLEKEKRIFYYRLKLTNANFILTNGKLISKQGLKNIITETQAKIAEIDPLYVDSISLQREISELTTRIAQLKKKLPKIGGLLVGTIIFIFGGFYIHNLMEELCIDELLIVSVISFVIGAIYAIFLFLSPTLKKNQLQTIASLEKELAEKRQLLSRATQ